MDEGLRKVDIIRERMDVGYGEAHEALSEADGDLVGALAHIEARGGGGGSDFGADLQAIIDNIVQEVRATLNGHPVERIDVQVADRTVKQVPVHLVGLGGVLAIGISALLAHVKLDLTMNDRASDPDSQTD